MNNLSHYHIGTTILICPKDKTAPVIEILVDGKAQGRMGQPTRVHGTSPHYWKEFGYRRRIAAGTYDEERKDAWLSPADWEVVGRVNKPKEAKS